MLLLYQMGKVGSTSINHALHNRGVTCIHAHWMQTEYPDGEFPTLKPHLVEKIKNKSEPIKVITLVREPLRRNISAFFEGLNYYTTEYRKQSPEELKEIFIKEYKVEYPDEWFRLELLDLFDFNLFEEKFDHSKGYKIYKSGENSLLLIRLENSNKVLGKAMRQFLGKWFMRMPKKNVFKHRHRGTFLGNKYREFLKNKFPPEFVERNYNLKYVNHFYSKKEIDKFKNRWIENGSIC